MSPTKTNASASESSRPRKVSTQKQKNLKAFKQRKIPKGLDKPLCFYGAKFNDFMNGVATIQPPDVSESLAPQTQDTILNLDSYLPPANSVHSQSPISTRVHRQGGAEPSGSYGVPVPYPNFNAHPAAEDNILSLTSTGNPCQSCGRYDPSCHIIPSSSSTGSLNMEYGVEPYQQFLDPNTQYFIPQPIQPYVSNASSTVTFPGHSYDIYAAITGSSDLMMTSESANDETVTALPFPNSSYDTKYPHNYYM